jgi:hypothetical protein
VQQAADAIAILNAGLLYDDFQQQAKGVDDYMSLAAGDLLARATLRINRAPLCATLARDVRPTAPKLSVGMTQASFSS